MNFWQFLVIALLCLLLVPVTTIWSTSAIYSAMGSKAPYEGRLCEVEHWLVSFYSKGFCTWTGRSDTETASHHICLDSEPLFFINKYLESVDARMPTATAYSHLQPVYSGDDICITNETLNELAERLSAKMTN